MQQDPARVPVINMAQLAQSNYGLPSEMLYNQVKSQPRAYLPSGAANHDLRGANLDLSKDLSPIQDLGRDSDSALAHQALPVGSQHPVDLNIGNSSFYTAQNPVNSSNPISVAPLSENPR